MKLWKKLIFVVAAMIVTSVGTEVRCTSVPRRDAAETTPVPAKAVSGTVMPWTVVGGGLFAGDLKEFLILRARRNRLRPEERERMEDLYNILWQDQETRRVIEGIQRTEAGDRFRYAIFEPILMPLIGAGLFMIPGGAYCLWSSFPSPMDGDFHMCFCWYCRVYLRLPD